MSTITTKTHHIYTCNACGTQFPKWIGHCTQCGEWNTITEDIQVKKDSRQLHRIIGESTSFENRVSMISQVDLTPTPRISTCFSELNRVLGGGLVTGSVVLLGGNPGIGKSTLLLQTLCRFNSPNLQAAALYITGEESIQQIVRRARRLQLPENQVKLLADTQLETILATIQREKPTVVVIDSIQTIWTNELASTPGTISQVRTCAAQLTQLAKQMHIALFIVGHVTKEGAIAGPRVLEHIVDTVLYFESPAGERFRIVRAVKNRFGPVNEIGIFAMTQKGLQEITNPSALFLSSYDDQTAGHTIMATWEGTRPLLIEIQALLDHSYLANPRRVTIGLESHRLAMLLAVLHRQGGISTATHDIFVNAVGGVKIVETAADLAVLLAIVSSLKEKPLPPKLIVFGEVGLTGEVRPVQNGQERLKEALKHGFTQAIIPEANCPKKPIPGLGLLPVKHVKDALRI
jgi:DNA repair protein RadA/Sms